MKQGEGEGVSGEVKARAGGAHRARWSKSQCSGPVVVLKAAG